MRATWRQRRGHDLGDVDTLHLQPLYDGTIKLMLDCSAVLPLAISLDGSKPACEIGAMTVVREADDCHQIMEWIAAAHERGTGTGTVYHRQEDALLTQVRGSLRG